MAALQVRLLPVAHHPVGSVDEWKERQVVATLNWPYESGQRQHDPDAFLTISCIPPDILSALDAVTADVVL